jgi:hypothetical protein
VRSDAPLAIVPVPASLFAELRGRRVIVGVPGVGFRGGLRADDAVTTGGRTFVPVLTEQDYYRAEIEQIEVFAPMVPIDRVWVEHVGEGLQPVRSQGALDAPLPRQAAPAITSSSLIGARVVQAVPDGFIRDLRAVTDVFTTDRGTAVRVCGEADWYRWALAGTTPSTIDALTQSLWVE